MIYNECDCDINKSFENKNIEIQGSTDIVIIQGDTNRREIIVDIDMELIEGIYFSCKDLDLNKKCIRGDKYFILEFSPSETQDLPIYTGTYDLTLKMFEGSIKTICLDETLMVLEKRNKVDYNADDNTQEIVVVLNLPEQTIIPDKNKTVTKITIPNSLLENKEVSSSFEEQVVTKGTEYYGLNEVKIKPIETETKEVELDFSTSNIQRVVNTKDKAMTEVAINKPVTLVSDNIKKGINIGGIDGSYEVKLQSKEITITQNGESEILPDEGYSGLSKVGITVNAGEPEKGVIFSDYDENGLPQQVLLKNMLVLFEKQYNTWHPADGELMFVPSMANNFYKKVHTLNIECPQGVGENENGYKPSVYFSNKAFQYFSSLNKINLINGDGWRLRLNPNVFSYCGFTELTISDDYMWVLSSAFSNNLKLKKVVFTNYAGTSLSSSAFDGCSSLEEINTEDLIITKLYSYVFSGCSKLTNLIIPPTVLEIFSGALRIGSTTNKATITFKGTTPPTITTDILNAKYLNKIYVPSSAVEAYKTATNWVNFADYIEADPNE